MARKKAGGVRYILTGNDNRDGEWAVTFDTEKDLLDSIKRQIYDALVSFLDETEEEGGDDHEDALELIEILDEKVPFSFRELEIALRHWNSITNDEQEQMKVFQEG